MKWIPFATYFARKEHTISKHSKHYISNKKDNRGRNFSAILFTLSIIFVTFAYEFDEGMPSFRHKSNQNKHNMDDYHAENNSF